jgi:hypothetical protein
MVFTHILKRCTVQEAKSRTYSHCNVIYIVKWTQTIEHKAELKEGVEMATVLCPHKNISLRMQNRIFLDAGNCVGFYFLQTDFTYLSGV